VSADSRICNLHVRRNRKGKIIEPDASRVRDSPYYDFADISKAKRTTNGTRSIPVNRICDVKSAILVDIKNSKLVKKRVDSNHIEAQVANWLREFRGHLARNVR